MEAIQSEKEFSKEAIDLESSRYEYDPWLLDDHPLRSYPTECIPGLGAYLEESIGRRKKALLRAGCLLFGCLAAFQLIRFLPINTKSLPHEPSAQIDTRPHTGACAFPTLDTRPQALESSLAAGCDGVRIPVWMHNGELQVGNAVTRPNPDTLLNRLGLDPLLAKLDGVVADVPNTPGGSHSGSAGTFFLMLDAKSSLHELFPVLVDQLDTLRQRGSLSHWDGESIVERPVTVVLTSEGAPASDCGHFSHPDILQFASPEGRAAASHLTRDGLQQLSPTCIA
ncbi:unnamed protein product [Penicillium salamii]|nr:unnamed protein product [Penicillium salamii]CAG8427477.1 unnamed protein product [Penicillium salamii]